MRDLVLSIFSKLFSLVSAINDAGALNVGRILLYCIRKKNRRVYSESEDKDTQVVKVINGNQGRTQKGMLGRWARSHCRGFGSVDFMGLGL